MLTLKILKKSKKTPNQFGAFLFCQFSISCFIILKILNRRAKAGAQGFLLDSLCVQNPEKV